VEFLSNLLSVLIFLTSLILILLILVQRGRGGGLIGALGGTGGSSAFGSRAGDTFTRITLIGAGIWMLMIMVQIWIQPFVNG
jgi:preprotein translocase subunit SecG